MTYRTAFPTFDPQTMPRMRLEYALCFTDVSDAQDEKPRFRHARSGLIVDVDFLSHDDRAMLGAWPRFSVWDDGPDERWLFNTDEWTHVLAMIDVRCDLWAALGLLRTVDDIDREMPASDDPWRISAATLLARHADRDAT